MSPKKKTKKKVTGPIVEVDQDWETKDKREKGLIRLDVACGCNLAEGFVGVDISKNTDASIIHDLNSYPWPFEDGSVMEVRVSHYLEHTADIKRFMEELWRITVHAATIVINAPYYSSIRAWQDYTHVRTISEATFLYFNRDWMQMNRLEHYGVNCNFAIQSVNFLYSGEWKVRANSAQEYARKHYLNVVDDIVVTLRTIKEQKVEVPREK